MGRLTKGAIPISSLLLVGLTLLSPRQGAAEFFSIVVVPDTQSYAENNPAIIEAQAQWIVENMDRQNIAYVQFLGDLKDDLNCNNIVSDPPRTEWDVVSDAVLILEDPVTTGLTDGIPYGILPGNHDFEALGGNCPNDEVARTLVNPDADQNSYDEYFGPAVDRDPTRADIGSLESRAYYLDNTSPIGTRSNRIAGSNEDNYVLFDANGFEFIAINLSYRENPGPAGTLAGLDCVATPNPINHAEICWARARLAEYPTRIGIVSSHFILQEANDGTAAWASALLDNIADMPNLFTVLGAHDMGESWTIEPHGAALDGTDIQVMLNNYQDFSYPDAPINFSNIPSEPGGGLGNGVSGLMRIMRFDTCSGLVHVTTFAPAAVCSLTGGVGCSTTDDLVSDFTIGFSDGDSDGFSDDQDENTASNLSFPFWQMNAAGTDQVLVNEAPVVSLLVDTSGSMNWDINGASGVPADEQRIFYARESAKAFLDLMVANPANAGQASFALSAFPDHPVSSCAAPAGEEITPVTSATIANVNAHTGASGVIDGLSTGGGTPLLAGLEVARTRFGAGDQCRSILLLTDGYHNCPSTVDSTSGVVDAAIDLLNQDQVRLYTVGFGIPGDTDNTLHQRLADDTTPTFPDVVAPLSQLGGSQFYDATDDLGLDTSVAGSWASTAKPALDAVFKSILERELGLQAILDPIDTIGAGQTRDYTLPINEFDREISLLVSWTTPDAQRLDVSLIDSSGDPVVPDRQTVRVSGGLTYRIISVSESYLRRDGRVSAIPWRLRVGAQGIAAGDEETFQYGVMTDSSLRLEARIGHASLAAGDEMLLTARVTRGGAPVTGLDGVVAFPSRPEEGRGNWFAQNLIDTKQLARVPQTIGGETLLPFQRKQKYLVDIAQVQYPGRFGAGAIRLYDDGSHGDRYANDGIYSNRYATTDKEGVYSFLFHADGDTPSGAGFSREKLVQRHLAVRPDEDTIELTSVTLTDGDARIHRLGVVPRDRLGNYFGPGQGAKIQLTWRNASTVGPLVDHLDGRYTQDVRIAAGQTPENVDVTVQVGDAVTRRNLDELSRRAWLSFHIGISEPSGGFASMLDTGRHFAIDYERRLGDSWRFAADLQYDLFDGKSGAPDTSVLALLAGLQYHFSSGSGAYLAAGGGVYDVEFASTDPGLYVGAGYRLELDSRLALDFRIRRQRIFSSGSDENYSSLGIGLIRSF